MFWPVCTGSKSSVRAPCWIPSSGAPLAVLALDPEAAWRAAEIRAAHDHRSTCPLSLGDAILVASAGAGDAIATADPHVLAVTSQRGVGTRALLDSHGRRR